MPVNWVGDRLQYYFLFENVSISNRIGNETTWVVLERTGYTLQYYKYDSADTDRLGKMLWIILLPGINVVRYYVKNVKPPVSSELINVAVQVAFDSFLWLAVGPRAVGFLFLCTYLYTVLLL